MREEGEVYQADKMISVLLFWYWVIITYRIAVSLVDDVIGKQVMRKRSF